MLRSYPHGEDYQQTAGGDSDTLRGPLGRSVSMSMRGMPPDVDRTTSDGVRGEMSELTLIAAATTADMPGEELEPEIDFLKLVREAETQAQTYLNQTNTRAWTQAQRAFHNEHSVGSKYTKPEWRARSKIFRPKTRSAVRKDMAAVAASMFGTVDAISCAPGNEADPRQRAAAAVMQELVNYRTDRNSTRSAIPWFQVAMGARLDALLTGICVSKQSWKLDLRRRDEPEYEMVEGPDGTFEQVERDVYVPDTDRPDIQLIPPENLIIDPAAEWTNPIQSATYVIIKWPMRIDEIRRKQQSPFNPWNEVSEAVLRGSTDSGKFDTAAMRRAREMGMDRLDETQTGLEFQVLWVYETFMKVGGEDWTFISVADKAFLTDPRPVREVYPEQHGDRPLTMGYGFLESHRIFPMSPVESWQQFQVELNDLANLTLDAVKQNVMPVTKVRRGRQIDMDQVKRRSSGSSIIVSEPDDVTWERPPDVPQSVPQLRRDLELELDDLAGQFNGQTAQDNNALSRTLGGLKLVAGSANAVQEFDIRIWIQTWVEPVLTQIVRLEQYYESDPVVLGLCGERAQLHQKYGIDAIDDDLLEHEISVRVSVGLGAGDPQQRLAKFQAAAQIVMPVLERAPEFISGELTIDATAIMQEVFGAAGYRDGGMRFLKKGPGKKQDPNADLERAEREANIDKARKQGTGSILQGLAAVAKVQLGEEELQAQRANAEVEFGQKANDQILAATDMGHRHAAGLAQSRMQAMQPQPMPPPPPPQAPPPQSPFQVPTAHPSPSVPEPQSEPTPPAEHPTPPIVTDALNAPRPQMTTPPAAGRQAIEGGLSNPMPAPQSSPGPQPAMSGGGKRVVFQRDPATGRLVGAIIMDQPPPAAPLPPDSDPVPVPPPGMFNG